MALLTGAGRGIGLAIARALAGQGCAVAIQDIELDVAAKEVEELRRQGRRAVALGGDIRDMTLPERLVAEARRELGGLDILVNNAAIQSTRHWTENSVAECEEQWRANLLAPLLLCQQVVAGFKQKGWGRILNVGSIQGRAGNPTMMPYAMSKAALENMTKGMARDLVKDGVTVNNIAPGYFNTWRNRGDFKTPEELADKGKFVPMGHVAEPEEAAGVAVMLCSEAGRYITGQTIYVDGGLTVKYPI